MSIRISKLKNLIHECFWGIFVDFNGRKDTLWKKLVSDCTKSTEGPTVAIVARLLARSLFGINWEPFGAKFILKKKISLLSKWSFKRLL
jgi:hypothetical protein